MPIIDLPTDLMASPLARDWLGAWMLWPGDEQRRSGAIQRYAAKRLYEERHSLGRDDLIKALELALGAPDEASLQDEVSQLFPFGFSVGNVVRNVIGMAAAGQTCSLQEQWKAHAASFGHRKGAKDQWPLQQWRSSRPLPSSPQVFLNTYWPMFKPVAHMWAAHVHIALEQRDEPFPCAATNLTLFLGLSEQFRQAAAKTKVKGAAGPLIADGEAITLSPEIQAILPALPPLRLVPQPI